MGTFSPMKPRIGVTSIRTDDGARRVEQVNLVYCDAVKQVGALAFVLPVGDGADAAEMLSSLDGLLLTGGGDVAAWYFGQEDGPEACGVDPARDAWELALLAAAGATGVPVLGICRGAQLLNVAAGGTLIPHLPAVTPVAHRVTERDREAVHTVEIEPASLLARVLGIRAPIGVNSLHHQAVGQVAQGFRPVAWSPDGMIEAIESCERPQLGVQWHPELLTARRDQAELFGWLARQAAARRAAPELLDAVA
ncbi:MAG: putative glutamine amidotransferase [Acidimicrobiaceae bacterium]|nr:putative glutamine amidotransferase [Acidimicrobiaceae bacterium]